MKSEYYFLLPAAILFAILIVSPALQTFAASFTQWNLFSSPKFVGLDNYLSLGSNGTFLVALKNNLLMIVLFSGLTSGIGLLLALLLEVPIRGRILVKGIVFLPMAISLTVAGIIWTFVYNPDFGSLNGFLRASGLDFLIQGWLSDGNIAIYSIIVSMIWVWSGFAMITFSAAIKYIPSEVTEAASIDGAGIWHKFRYVLLPLLIRPLLVVFSLTMIWSLKAFDLFFVMTRGGPYDSTQVLALYMWFEAFLNLNAGFASTIAVVLFVLVLAIAIPYLRKLGEKGVAY